MKKLWKKSRNFWILLIFLSTTVLLVWQSEQVRSSVLESVDLFMTNLFPVLFPFFVLFYHRNGILQGIGNFFYSTNYTNMCQERI